MSTMNKTVVQALMKQYISVKAKEIMSAKPQGKQYMELQDMEQLTAYLEGMWASKCGEVPVEITAISNMACAALEPDKARTQERIKKALAAVSGVGGVTAIISAVATALGWGVSVWAAITAAVAGVSLAGPIGLAVVGSLAVCLAGYLMFSSDSKEEASEKALKIFREGIVDVITDSLWDKYKDRWQD